MGLWALVSDSRRHNSVVRAGFREAIHRSGLASAGVVLATCQRIEVYGCGPVPIAFGGLEALEEDQAALHLIRVATGLESAVLGEDEILHQVRRALAEAKPECLSTEVRRLFETAIAAGRRARAGRTVLMRGLVAQAFDWLLERTDLSSRPILVVGTGSIGVGLARAARMAGAQVIVASRSFEHAAAVAAKLSVLSITLNEASDLAPFCSGVLVALAGSWHQLTRVPPCPVVDLSAPAAISRPVQAALGDRFLGIDDLIATSRSENGIEIGSYRLRAETVVADDLDEYLTWLCDRRSRRDLAMA